MYQLKCFPAFSTSGSFRNIRRNPPSLVAGEVAWRKIAGRARSSSAHKAAMRSRSGIVDDVWWDDRQSESANDLFNDRFHDLISSS
jgi:hypothetical protein